VSRISAVLVASIVLSIGFGAGVAQAAAVPAIASLSPSSGPVGGGEAVTIKGIRFTGATSVKFGTIDETFTVVDDTTITTVAPSGSVGTTYIVTVTTPSGVSSGAPSGWYTVVDLPAVTAVSTGLHPTAGGNTVGIGGTGLTGATAVYFGSTAATGLVPLSDTSLSVIAPPAASGPGPVHITVVTAGGTSATTTKDIYTYVSSPVVSGLSVTAGQTAGNNGVTITGTGLTGTTAVHFGAAAATNVTVVNDTTVTVLTPPGSVGSVDVTVTTAYGTSPTNASDVFSYVVKPVVTSSSPSVGPVTGGTTVTIIGTGFTGATAVEFGTTPTTDFVVNSDTSITAISIAAVTGPGSTVNVTVDTPGGTANQVASAIFQFMPVPTVTSVSPASGDTAGGNTVTITGTGLIPVRAVHFGSIAATSFSVGTGTSLTATVPAGVSGPVDVTVTTDGGTTATGAADLYSYIGAPVVTALSPTSGPSAGGTVVTITGQDLMGATAVKFGSVPATSFVVISNTSLTAVAPAGTGVVGVLVTSAHGTSTAGVADQYTHIARPSVAALSTATGSAYGGTSVTITGTGFTDASTVDFGAVAATSFTVNSDGSITAVAPGNSVGTVDVTVTTPGGTSATSAADQFTFVAPIITVGPTTLPDGTRGASYSQSLTASGDLSDTYTFAITAGALPDGLTLGLDGTIFGTPTVTGPFDFTVTATGSDGYDGSEAYVLDIAAPAPVVSSISPTAGTVYGGTSVTISGSGFTGALLVEFGGTAAASYVVNSDASITAIAPFSASTWTVDVTVTTVGGTSKPVDADQFTFTPPTITVSPTSLSDGQQGVAYSQALTGNGDQDDAYTFALTAGALPDGLTLGADGTISGTPTVSGPFHFTVTATGSDSYSGSSVLTMTIAAPAPVAPPSLTLTPQFSVGDLVDGATVGITAAGFDAGQSVTAVVHSTPITLYSAIIDGTGGLTATVTLPTLAEGSHELVVTAGTQEKDIWFAVSSAGVLSALSTTGPVTDPTGGLAFTGTDVAGPLSAAGGLLLAGLIALAAVFLGRRRREARQR
jgi:hypothetical protein